MSSLTRGRRSLRHHRHQKVYDRLRKRSLRIEREGERLYVDGGYDDFGRFYDAVAVPFYGGGSTHQAYVRGVKDALEAIERQR